MKKAVSILLALGICLFSAFSVMAATASPALYSELLRYDRASESWVTADEIGYEDLVMVKVGFASAGIRNLGALKLKMTYTGSTVTYVPRSAATPLTAGDPLFTDKYNTASPDESYLITYLSLSSATGNDPIAAAVQGDVATYIFKCVAADGKCEFSVSVLELYDTDYKKLALANSTATASAAIVQQGLDDGELAAFEKVSAVTYPDSKGDIEAADKAYEALTGKQQLLLKNKYPQLFEDYQSAWRRYYDLANSAAVEAVQQEVKSFLIASGAVLDLMPEDVTEENYQSVLEMYSRYKTLSDQAKVRLTDAQSQRIRELNEKAKEIEDILYDRMIADDGAQLFIDTYAVLWGVSDEAVKLDYESMKAMVDEALKAYKEDLDFENMSSGMQEKVAQYGQILERYAGIIRQAEADAQLSREILDEISAFSQKWSKVLALNAVTVTVGDRTAIEMMLEDYEKLSDAAKEQLLSQKNNGQQLLSVIAAMEEKPGAVRPGETETVPVETEVIKTNSIIRNMPKFVLVMLILAGIAVLSVFAAGAVYYGKLKKGKIALKKGG